MIQKKHVFALLFLFFSRITLCVSDTIPAQYKADKEHFLHFGVSGMKFAVRDYATSPLIYSGFLPGFKVGASFQGKHVTTVVDYYFSYGKLATRNYPTIDNKVAEAYNNYLSLGLCYKANKPRHSLSWYLGGHIGILANFRRNDKFNNADFNYEGVTSLGPMIMLNKAVNLSPGQIDLGFTRWPFRARHIKLSALLVIPVVYSVTRPYYNTIEDFVDGNSPKFTLDRSRLVSLGKLFSIISQANLNYYLHNGNKFMLSYLWSYYSYFPASNKFREVSGVFSFSFVLKLNK